MRVVLLLYHMYIIYVCGFHQYIITGVCGMVPDWLFSVGFLRAICFFFPQLSGKWSKDYENGYDNDQALWTLSRDGD